ncbi:S-adenosyl-L-methionine-dependent methyltransferase [Phycomyces nitens]|nr:S-adenosyl-L-methionine-dependent methyltransferase [Phycomyces nitens]
MGNSSSHQVPDAVSSSLSPNVRRRISQNPGFIGFFEGSPLKNASRKKTRTPSLAVSSSSTLSSKNDARTSIPPLPHSRSSSGLSETSTLVSPLLDVDNASDLVFEMVQGRRYLVTPGTNFNLPCDDEEADRLVILHFLLRYAFSGNFGAPVADTLHNRLGDKTPPRVLDIGCGPGTWVLEMATEFPHAEFYGTDVRTMFPTTIKPSNSHFCQHNFLKGLPYASNSFDYVHMSLMLFNLTHVQFMNLLAEITRVLKPGGYYELKDTEYRIERPGPICDSLLNHKVRKTMLSQGIELYKSHHISTFLMTQPGSNGFVDVHQRRITIPLGWGGQLGDVHAQNVETFFQSLSPRIKDAARSTDPDEDVLSNQVIQHAMRECKKYQSHLNWYVCYGQKPPMTDTLSNPPTPLKATFPSPVMPDEQLGNMTWESINDFVEGYID